MPDVPANTLLIHGDMDEVVPYRFGKKLFDACTTQPKEFLTIRGLHHNDAWPEEFWDEGKKFVEEH